VTHRACGGFARITKDDDRAMKFHVLRRASTAALAVAVLLGVFWWGRHSAPGHRGTWNQGYSVGYDEGISVGRELQVGAPLNPDAKDVATNAFKSGYQAGLTDSFGSYDGGWSIGHPYVIVMEKGVGDAPYRIDQRELLQPGVTYELCQDGNAICPK